MRSRWCAHAGLSYAGEGPRDLEEALDWENRELTYLLDDKDEAQKNMGQVFYDARLRECLRRLQHLKTMESRASA